MSYTNVINDNTATKKCGEIIITMKKNAKNVYSFNCWFCDTICIQMKKFTLHIEQEHIAQLEHITSNITNENPDIKMCTEKTSDAEIFLTDKIKLEVCEKDGIKAETLEEEHPEIVESLSKKDEISKYQDPLETNDDNLEISLPVAPNNNELIILEIEKNEANQNKHMSEDVEMQDFSEDDNNDVNSGFSDDDNSDDSDFKVDDNEDEKLITALKGNAKVKEKELILALIEAYNKNPELWNTSLSERCNIKQKDDIFQSITDDINEKLKLKLKLYMVKKKLNYICKQYEMEVKKQISESDKSTTVNSELWFYENMSFLKSVIESKLKLKKKKPNHKVKPLDENLICDLIEIYKNYNSLWDVNHLAYTVKDKRHETMQTMVEEINSKMNLSLDVYKLGKHLYYIHKSFANNKQLKLENQDFQPKCSYFSKCDFLEAHQGPFRCSNCSEIIETYNKFQIHKSQHDDSMPFKCQECGMGFKKITNYTIHAKRHLRVFKFHCEICGKGYPFNAELNLHMRSHTGAQPYLCSVCGEGFRTAISYDNHIRRHEERFKYFCHICKKGFNHMTRLNNHVKAHLNVRDVICTVCGKGFTSRKYLNHHKRIHEGKNYICTICGKSFAQDAGLRAHKKYHGTPIGISSIQKEQNKYKLF